MCNAKIDGWLQDEQSVTVRAMDGIIIPVDYTIFM